MKSVMGTDMKWDDLDEKGKADVTDWFEIAKQAGLKTDDPVEQWFESSACQFAHDIACWAINLEAYNKRLLPRSTAHTQHEADERFAIIQQHPLPRRKIISLYSISNNDAEMIAFARKIERLHGIK